MYQKLADVRLKNDEVVEAGVVLGPDEEWREHVQELLLDKDGIWNWQNTAMLREPLGIEARFHILHREGIPFCHMLVSQLNGVGLLSHVFTKPEDRGQGAASRLMELMMAQFQERGGQAMYLATGYDTPPYHIYRKQGFAGIEPQSGIMSFFATSQEEFETEYFAPGEVVIEPLDWHHWPVASALFAGDWPQAMRCAPLKLFGRTLTEGQLLPAIHARRTGVGDSKQTFALVKPANGAVVGLAATCADPIWPQTRLIDVFCHPNFGYMATDLLQTVTGNTHERLIAYSDESDEKKVQLLRAAGFQFMAQLPQWLPADTARSQLININVWTRT